MRPPDTNDLNPKCNDLLKDLNPYGQGINDLNPEGLWFMVYGHQIRVRKIPMFDFRKKN